MLKIKSKLGRRLPLVKKLLLIEGISRTGKFLLNNLLAGINSIEPGQCHTALENIPRLIRLGFLDKLAGQELLRIVVDQYCYEMLIGRNSFNYRLPDKSYIFNNPRHQIFFERYRASDGAAAVKKFYREKLFSSFIAHETLPNIQIFLNTFPQLKVLSIQRSPIALVYSWFKRNLDKRTGSDPIMGEMIFSNRNLTTPWYLISKAVEYNSLNKNADRTILAIETLFKINKITFKKLAPSSRSKILFLHYEDLTTNPHPILKKISAFLNKKIIPSALNKIIKSEGLPNPKSNDLTIKIKELSQIASPSYFKRLLKLEAEYTSRSLF